MKGHLNISAYFAVFIGIILLLEGIGGLNHDYVLAIFSTNFTHAVIHLILGIAGIALGLKHRAEGFLVFLGYLLIAVGVLYFVPGAGGSIRRILNVNIPVALLNTMMGSLCLLSVYATKGRDETAHSHQ
jgi:uncharacterized protein DUF4383